MTDDFDPVAAAGVLDDDEDLSADARLARGEDGGEDGEGLKSIRQFEALAEAKAKERADADKLFAEQMQEAAQLSGDWVEPHEDSDIEIAAVKIAAEAGNPLFLQEMRELLEKANAETVRKANAGREGFDDYGDPTVPPPPPFDPSGLDSEGFGIFMAAAARGGADPRKTPVGFSPTEWAKAVDSALGRAS
jgi:hypothetical protein